MLPTTNQTELPVISIGRTRARETGEIVTISVFPDECKVNTSSSSAADRILRRPSRERQAHSRTVNLRSLVR